MTLQRGIRNGALLVLVVGTVIGASVLAASAPVGSSGPSTSADIIFVDGSVITMDDARPTARAVAILGDRIVAVGAEQEVQQLRGPNTTVVNLQGRTLVPGFIDSHQHRIGDRSRIGVSAETIIEMALADGLTTINELYVDQSRLDELRELDEAGTLRLRVNAYLPINENSPAGKPIGDYYTAYRPGQMVSPHVRVAGLKVFTDFDNATTLIWNQEALNAALLKEHRNGWQLAVKTVSTSSLEMILEAFRAIEKADPGIAARRHRLEHNLFATPDQIAEIKRLGIVSVINLNVPGQLIGQPDIDALIGREPARSYAPWRSMFRAGIAPAGCSGFPSFYVEEPTGAPFGSPIHLIYQGVTRVGNLGVRPDASLLDQALTAEESLRALTVNGARAVFEDDDKGVIARGKLADLVVLSADPLTASAEAINGITVLTTIVGGKVEYCGFGSPVPCPDAGEALETSTPGGSVADDIGVSASQSVAAPHSITAVASASLPDSPPSAVLDGNPEAIWNAGAGPEQWIQIDLGKPTVVKTIRLIIAQYPAGETVHQIWGGANENGLSLLGEFRGFTKDPDTLEFSSVKALTNIRYIRIVTSQSPSWVAWREIEVIGP
jgi:predicted amidohydrolase YtcJ